MSAAQAAKLLAGATIYFRDLVSLLDYAGTVSSVVPNQTVTIAVPNGGGSKTFSIAGDQSVELPFYPTI